MKMRLVLALVAVAAVLCWLAVPAVRIWRNPSIRAHVHARSSPLFKVTDWRIEPPFAATTYRVRGEAMEIQHHAPFASRYWAMLLGRRWSDPSACGLDGSIYVEAVMDDPKPPRYGTTLAKGVIWLLDKARKKGAADPPK